MTENQSAADLIDYFIGRSFKNEVPKSFSRILPERQTDANDNTSVSDHFSSLLVEEEHVIRSRSQLGGEQHKDPKILFLFHTLSVIRIWHRILSAFKLKMKYC